MKKKKIKNSINVILDIDEDITDIQKEITVLSQCDSPYITKYYGSYIVDTKLWIGILFNIIFYENFFFFFFFFFFFL